MKVKRSRVRVSKVLVLVFFCAFLACISKLLYVAISPKVDGMNLREFADIRNTKKRVIPATRGNIYDVNGETIASNANSYTLIAYLSEKRTTNPDNPQHVVDKENTAKALSEVLDMDYDYVLSRLKVEGAYQVEFGTKGKNLSENQKVKIDSLGLPGIGFIAGGKRYYKNTKMASYIVGYAKTSEDGEITGQIGIEKHYDDLLKGEDGYSEYQVDGKGYQMGEPLVNKEPVSGSDVYLTIDTGIQLILEDALHILEENYNFDWFTMTVVDAKTGAIVGSTASPSFNPNDVSTIKSYLNPLVSYTYEPGSTMKIYSWLAALENSVYNGSEEYDSGTIEIDNYTIKDYNNVGWGKITYDKGFAYSSNVAATKLAVEKLGSVKLKEFYESLGFGAKTGIELPNEEKGILKMTYKSELATSSFGQGITTTPIQNLQALTIFTNDGEMIKPYIVDKIVDQKGNITYQGGRTSLGQKASSENVKKMRELMYDVVYHGVSNYYQPSNVILAGKTGTAEFADSKTGKYLGGSLNRIRSFAGFFPYENPKYIFYVSVKKLDGENKALASAVVKAIESIANYSNITNTPNTNDITKLIKIDNYLSNNVK